MPSTYWKIFDERDAMPLTLFHGVGGTRRLRLESWIVADKKMVTDGSRAMRYQSGFHLLLTREECAKYLRQFKNTEHKVIAQVEAEGVSRKPDARQDVQLANMIYIPKKHWDARITYKELMV